MNKLSLSKFWITCLTLSLVAGCGGGGGGTSVAGIDRLGVTAGTVNGFGSIIVNGATYETDSASFDVDDDSAGSSQDDLDVGDIVVVTYDLSSPMTAIDIVSDEAVEGPVNSVNLAAGSLVVAGQTVFVSPETSFDDATGLQSLADLAVNDFVEVSGLFDADGSIRATRIERKLVAGEVEVHGIVSNRTASTFMINALTIDYVTVPAIIDDDFPGGNFANGDFVEVKGSNFNGATLLATKVEPDGLGVGEGGNQVIDDFNDFAEAEIEGFITRFVSATDFDVAGIPVTTTPGTVFEGGTAADLGLNVKVEVDGSINSAGTLVASEVDIRRTNDLRVVALVDSVNTANNTLTVLSVVVRVDAQTRVEDKSDADVEPFSLGDINVGDYVEARGSTDTGGADILALLLEREDVPDVPGEETELRGLVESIAQPLVTVAGVTIDTAGAVFRDTSDNVISGATFFATLKVGDLIDAKGTETGAASLSAEEVELEN